MLQAASTFCRAPLWHFLYNRRYWRLPGELAHTQAQWSTREETALTVYLRDKGKGNLLFLSCCAARGLRLPGQIPQPKGGIKQVGYYGPAKRGRPTVESRAHPQYSVPNFTEALLLEFFCDTNTFHSWGHLPNFRDSMGNSPVVKCYYSIFRKQLTPHNKNGLLHCISQWDICSLVFRHLKDGY